MAEAITDPEGDAWWDSAGNENGDDCGYVYGAVSGTVPGQHFNQTINGHHYLTQEEFSNADWRPLTEPLREPCLQGISPVIPTITAVSPGTGPTAGGQSVTITGIGFPGATAVTFGTTPATFTITDATHIAATAPSGTVGTVDIRVGTAAGTSPAVVADHFAYVQPAPTITSISPSTGPLSGGTTVTVTGTNLEGATALSFGASPASFTGIDASHVSAIAPPGVAGTVDIRVTTAGGTSAVVSADRFTYADLPPVPAAPVIASVSPASGPASGGTAVTLTGTALTGATSVTFAGTAAPFTVVDDTHVTATAPAAAPGPVDIVVTTAGGDSAAGAGDRYTYLAAPAVTGLSSTAGPLAGGATLTVTGSGLASTSSVSFGSTPTTFSVIDDVHLTVAVPAHAAGPVDVRVTSGGGTSAATASDRFTYLQSPVVRRVVAGSGPVTGGTTVTITGTGFVAGASVTIGGRAATHVVVTAPTRITARLPAHAAGAVDVRVRTAGGVSAVTAADRFRYLPRPVVTSVSPTSGTRRGGRVVTVRGTGFVVGVVVRFGTTTARVVSVVSTRIVVVTPRHARGRVAVSATTPGGTSAARVTARYLVA